MLKIQVTILSHCRSRVTCFYIFMTRARRQTAGSFHDRSTIKTAILHPTNFDFARNLSNRFFCALKSLMTFSDTQGQRFPRYSLGQGRRHRFRAAGQFLQKRGPWQQGRGVGVARSRSRSRPYCLDSDSGTLCRICGIAYIYVCN